MPDERKGETVIAHSLILERKRLTWHLQKIGMQMLGVFHTFTDLQDMACMRRKRLQENSLKGGKETMKKARRAEAKVGADKAGRCTRWCTSLMRKDNLQFKQEF